MCGIFFICSSQEHISLDDTTKQALRARGPDSLSVHHVQVNAPQASRTNDTISPAKHYLTFASSVLSLRGNNVCTQPLIDSESGSVLCWNGEAWKVNGVQVLGNDTEEVFRLLLAASKAASAQEPRSERYSDNLLEVLTRVAGPYAFVYFDALTKIIYFGRDRFGRRSLVINSSTSSSKNLAISSFNFDKEPATEVSTDGIHYLDLNVPSPEFKLIPWPTAAVSMNRITPDIHHNILSTPSKDAVVALRQHLSDAIRLRVLDVPTYTTVPQYVCKNPSRVAVLFSGGLDCTLIARIAHEILPIEQPIDLLNVAFENPRTIRAAAQVSKSTTSAASAVSPYESCPDRITARLSFTELTNVCPDRTWRFVTIDVPFSETTAHRSTVIKLMSPHNTEMDLSITLALYFASRGQGQAITSPSATPVPYTTTSRVLLSGLGADELFGGYARHAAAFNRTGYQGLIAELELDFTRIGSRNLGRDDRVMAHWGREIRYPYLDEDFVKFTLDLPVWEKVGFRPGKAVPKHFEGTGERILVDAREDLDPAKMLLRIAAWEMGMRGVAGEKKRAIQFGARTAKMEGGRTKGTDVLRVD